MREEFVWVGLTRQVWDELSSLESQSGRQSGSTLGADGIAERLSALRDLLERVKKGEREGRWWLWKR